VAETRAGHHLDDEELVSGDVKRPHLARGIARKGPT
jgi:hypothetical protein